MNFIKSMVNWAAMLAVCPLLLALKLHSFVFENSDGFFWSLSQLLSLIPGTSGIYLRKNFYHFALAKCSRECAILFGTLFAQVDTEIGRGVYIGPFCNIGSSIIKDHCTLGSGVHILSGKKQHGFEDLDRPIQEQGGSLEKIVIGEDSWIGNGALVMANIGKKCIVGAGSVVVQEVEDFSVVGGNPSRLIRKRGTP